MSFMSKIGLPLDNKWTKWYIFGILFGAIPFLVTMITSDSLGVTFYETFFMGYSPFIFWRTFLLDNSTQESMGVYINLLLMLVFAFVGVVMINGYKNHKENTY